MARMCPETKNYVLYLDCLECEDKICTKKRETKNEKMTEKVEKNNPKGESFV